MIRWSREKRLRFNLLRLVQGGPDRINTQAGHLETGN
uniref:Uncharacterized protein n=1 Tax=Rhizophora mucronata TaxID=61149 RepID=A0A2P2QVN1_RHIMU